MIISMENDLKEQGLITKKHFEMISVKFGLTMDQLIERGGISKPTFYRFINEGITDKNRKTFLNFCFALGVESEYVLEGEGEMLTKKVESNSDLMIILAKLEAQWKADNEYLKERLKAQEEMIKSQQETIAVLVRAKAEVIDIKPRMEIKEAVTLKFPEPKSKPAIELEFDAKEEKMVANYSF